MNKKIKGIIVLSVLAAALFTGFQIASATFFVKKETTGYEFTKIGRRDIENTISSSGTLEPVGKINVLAQMSGTVEKIYATYNDKVTKNQPLIDLNTELLRIQEKSAEASLLKAETSWKLAQLEHSNSAKLFEKKIISEYDYHSAKTSLDRAKADLISAEASLEELRIKLNQYALIISPIDGIVLSRDVEAGDTVVAGSSSTTTLFTLAESLSRMEVHAAVDELDISRVFAGQEARFTVDAYPKETFRGKVSEIRLMPQTINNIVSYTVIIDADNSSAKLLPGMTANLEFISEQKKDVLAVQSQALRFQPSEEEMKIIQEKLFLERIKELPKDEQEAALARRAEAQKSRAESSAQQGSSNILTGSMRLPGGSPPGTNRNNASSSQTRESVGEKKVLYYVSEDGTLSALQVAVGVTDGTYTEIAGTAKEELEGKNVILKIKVK